MLSLMLIKVLKPKPDHTVRLGKSQTSQFCGFFQFQEPLYGKKAGICANYGRTVRFFELWPVFEVWMVPLFLKFGTIDLLKKKKKNHKEEEDDEEKKAQIQVFVDELKVWLPFETLFFKAYVSGTSRADLKIDDFSSQYLVVALEVEIGGNEQTNYV